MMGLESYFGGIRLAKGKGDSGSFQDSIPSMHSSTGILYLGAACIILYIAINTIRWFLGYFSKI